MSDNTLFLISLKIFIVLLCIRRSKTMGESAISFHHVGLRMELQAPGWAASLLLTEPPCLPTNTIFAATCVSVTTESP